MLKALSLNTMQCVLLQGQGPLWILVGEKIESTPAVQKLGREEHPAIHVPERTDPRQLTEKRRNAFAF